ncbi:membrane dipeptidase [Pedobacter aquatilis]|uniref:membrane dipeptidase n=1 Tax=Pedobacter aquatilis TaxID=351343 RepID=UPI00292DBA8D|nr:membrane dipeptidase [Pedobacter aquatilis]
MQYFDLHCHPGLKTLFQPQNGTQKSPWENLEPHDGIIGNILESQSSLKMLTQTNGFSLVCITLHPPEVGMIDQVIISLASLLGFPRLLSRKRLDQMISQECLYQQVFYEELKNLTNLPLDQYGKPIPKNIRFLKRGEKIDNNSPNTLQVIFNIEGGHSLYDQKNKVKDIQAVKQNLTNFLDNENYKTLYITPTHLTPNQFITHCYGNKILSKGRLLPKGIGITQYGKELIDHAYRKDILIDVKHMSLVSRQIFYQYRKKYHPDKPIIASHVGMTGKYWKFFRDYYPFNKEKSYGFKATTSAIKGCLANTQYYPLSINLYFEDLREILNSKGLIGISLDVRILGGQIPFNNEIKEFFSLEEFKLLSSSNSEAQIESLTQKLINNNIKNGNTTIDATDEEGQENEEVNEATQELEEMAIANIASAIPEDRQHYKRHLYLVLNHILGIYKFTKDEGLAAPWNNICIGSDFDGLVEAVDCCRNAAELPQFAQSLIAELKTIEAAKSFEYPLDLSPEEIINKIMFANARDFINTYCK